MKLYANPYDSSINWFYFSNLAEYEAGVLESGAEEYMIDLVDADFNSTIFYGMKVSQCNIEESFELSDVLGKMNEEQLTAVEFLLDCGHSINFALDNFDDVCISSESLDDYAYGLMTECYDVPENLMNYLDYRAFGRDLKCEGSVVELNGYLITNANDF
jgi:antirestriction protein